MVVLEKLVPQFRLCKKIDAQIRKTTGACLVHQIVEIRSMLSSFPTCNNQLGKGAAKSPQRKWLQSSLASSILIVMMDIQTKEQNHQGDTSILFYDGCGVIISYEILVYEPSLLGIC